MDALVNTYGLLLTC